jgi:hypothetical protein
MDSAPLLTGRQAPKVTTAAEFEAVNPTKTGSLVMPVACLLTPALLANSSQTATVVGRRLCVISPKDGR